MKALVFQASTDQTLYGITPDNGSNLPPLANDGRWVYVNQIELVPGQSLVALDPDEALKSIQAQGYHLAGAKVTVTITDGVQKPF